MLTAVNSSIVYFLNVIDSNKKNNINFVNVFSPDLKIVNKELLKNWQI